MFLANTSLHSANARTSKLSGPDMRSTLAIRLLIVCKLSAGSDSVTESAVTEDGCCKTSYLPSIADVFHARPAEVQGFLEGLNPGWDNLNS